MTQKFKMLAISPDGKDERIVQLFEAESWLAAKIKFAKIIWRCCSEDFLFSRVEWHNQDSINDPACDVSPEHREAFWKKGQGQAGFYDSRTFEPVLMDAAKETGISEFAKDGVVIFIAKA